MKIWASCLALAAVALVCLGCAPESRPGAALARPNIVFILVDDLGLDDVGFHGGPVETPHLDSLASEGIELDRLYSMPFCSPTRSALMTGQHPVRLGMATTLCNEYVLAGLPLGETTLADVLRQAGYATHAVGKWHLGGEVKYWPTQRGFDHFVGFLGGHIDYFSFRHNGYTLQRDGVSFASSEYATRLWAQEAVKVIETPRNRPFFLYLAFNAPHTPWQAPPETIKALSHLDASRRTFYAMVKELDQAVGQVLHSLKQTRQEQNTIVVFQSDNGRDPLLTPQDLLRGDKGSTYEGGIRVPGALKWPLKIKPGQKSEQVISVLDWFVTLTAMAGVNVPQPPKDGQNLWPALEQETPRPRKPLYITTLDFNEESVIHGSWKYRINQVTQEEELFHLFADPSESNNQLVAHPAKAAELRRELRHWHQQRSKTTLRDYAMNADEMPNFLDWALFYKTFDAMEQAGDFTSNSPTIQGRTQRLWEARTRLDDYLAAHPEALVSAP